MRLPSISRRQWLTAAAGAGVCLIGGSDLVQAAEFWNKKPPAKWSSDEVLQLATRSPWAKTARVVPRAGRDRGSFQQNGPEIGGGGGGRSENPKLGEVPEVPVAEATVVWESARPLLDAMHTTFPADFANHYVIGVIDLPAGQGKHKVDLESLAANLQAHGRDSVDAGGFEPLREVLLCAFARDLLPLTAADKDVTFTLETNEFSIKARFDLKEMMYHGVLAV